MLCDNLSVNEKGHLTFAGQDTVELARRYGTPLYLMDENKIRQHIRTYRDAMAAYLPAGSLPEFASKAFCCKQIYRIMAEEGIDIDVVSPGEIYTAKAAGFPMEKSFFHGNNKTDDDIRFAIEAGVGTFVADNEEELQAIDRLAGEKGIKQKILLRVTPGIDPHTHKKISTGSVDSKFGVTVLNGQALSATAMALGMAHLDIRGFHCHIGSQIFDSSPFVTAAELMLDFLSQVREQTGYVPEYLNMGGGFGVRYTEQDPVIDYAEKIKEVADAIARQCQQKGFAVPKILMEPGRSLVADAGLTLYTVGGTKEIPGYKNYVSIDGGMTDNPRYTLYEAPYTLAIANRANEKKDFVATVGGRCCESGDLIQEDVAMPKPKRGDLLAVMTTGAYNYSMASNYNRVARPPVVMLKNGESTVIVRRETLADLCALDK